MGFIPISSLELLHRDCLWCDGDGYNENRRISNHNKMNREYNWYGAWQILFVGFSCAFGIGYELCTRLAPLCICCWELVARQLVHVLKYFRGYLIGTGSIMQLIWSLPEKEPWWMCVNATMNIIETDIMTTTKLQKNRVFVLMIYTIHTDLKVHAYVACGYLVSRKASYVKPLSDCPGAVTIITSWALSWCELRNQEADITRELYRYSLAIKNHWIKYIFDGANWLSFFKNLQWLPNYIITKQQFYGKSQSQHFSSIIKFIMCFLITRHAAWCVTVILHSHQSQLYFVVLLFTKQCQQNVVCFIIRWLIINSRSNGTSEGAYVYILIIGKNKRRFEHDIWSYISKRKCLYLCLNVNDVYFLGNH